MKKNLQRLVLDVFMLLAIALFFKKNVLTLSYHEIAGLAIILLFVLHLIINRKWIVTVTKKFFDKSVKTRTKVGYVVDFLLLVCFIIILVTGIMISKIVFHFEAPNSAKLLHFMCSALVLILMGVHLGLHWPFFKNYLKKWFSFLGKAKNVIGVIILIAVVGFGGYSLYNSSVLRWLSLPFQAGTALGQGSDHAPGQGPGQGQGFGNGSGQGKGQQVSITFSSIVSTLLSYLTIMLLFATLTVLIDKAIVYLNHKKRVKLE